MQLNTDTREVIRKKTRKGKRVEVREYVAFLSTNTGVVIKEALPQVSRSEALSKLKRNESLADLYEEEEEEEE